MKETFFYGDKLTHNCYFEKTSNLRQFLKKTSSICILQQAYECQSCGNVKWRDVPIIIEGEENGD